SCADRARYGGADVLFRCRCGIGRIARVVDSRCPRAVAQDRTTTIPLDARLFARTARGPRREQDRMIPFHRFLIGTAILFCVGFAADGLVAYPATGAGSDLAFAVAFAVAGGALGYYLKNLNRFLHR